MDDALAHQTCLLSITIANSFVLACGNTAIIIHFIHALVQDTMRIMTKVLKLYRRLVE